MSKNLILRLVTGISGSAVLIFLLVYQYMTFASIVGVMCVLILHEFYSMTEKYQPLKWLGLLLGMSTYALAILYNAELLNHYYIAAFVAILTAIPITLLFDKNRKFFDALAMTFFGIVYIAIPFAMLILLAKVGKQNLDISYNRYMILGIFLIIWSNDTGAYFAGKAMGKTKLFSRVSPNKTVEGSVGGVVLALIIISIYFHYFVKADYPFMWWLIFTLVISVSGILGDLIESQMKRDLNIKDSSNVLPGHGGFLDRFDALIFAIPFAFICYLFL